LLLPCCRWRQVRQHSGGCRSVAFETFDSTETGALTVTETPESGDELTGGFIGQSVGALPKNLTVKMVVGAVDLTTGEGTECKAGENLTSGGKSKDGVGCGHGWFPLVDSYSITVLRGECDPPVPVQSSASISSSSSVSSSGFIQRVPSGVI